MTFNNQNKSWDTILKQLLDNHITGPGNHIVSHTSMHRGKWSIPDDKLELFYTKYTDAITAAYDEDFKVVNPQIAGNLTLTEKPNGCSPVKIDLDFRYLCKNPDKRRYTIDMIKQFSFILLNIIREWYLIGDDEKKCFVMEKKSPTVDENKSSSLDIPNTYLIKDGVHIMFPYLIIPNEMQLLFRDTLLKNKEINNIFDDMDLRTSIDKPQPMRDVIDKAVIDKNNWMLFGSHKPNNYKVYQLTNVFSIEQEYDDIFNINTNNYTLSQLVRLTSMRSKYTDSVIKGKPEPEIRIMGQIRCDKQKDLDNNIKIYKITAGKSFAPKGRKNKCRPKKKRSDELKILKMFIDALDSSRADDYNNWIEVGWACHNIDERLLEDWIMFSKKSHSYKQTAELACNNEWDKMYDEGLSEGSLRYWVKEDNPQRYLEILKIEAHDAIMNSVQKCVDMGDDKLNNALKEMKIQPYDVAVVLHAMYKHEFICVSQNGKYGLYYNFDNHRWNIHSGDILLRQKVSVDIPIIYKQAVKELVSKADSGDTESKDIISSFKEDLKRFLGMFNNISTTSFKNNVMVEGIELFYDKASRTNERFLNRLDSEWSSNLLSFDNGIYDLVKNEFREGRPEDYISFSTNIDYIDYEWDDTSVIEVMNFISQVLPDDDERDYVLILLASFLNGNNKNEKFHIWTGSGGNGKSKLIELYEKSIGDYGCKLPISLLTNKRQQSGQATPEMARTKGKRFAVLQEPDVDTQINVGLMKEWTGNDRVQARALYCEPIEFKPQIKMILTCNHLPKMPYDDEATWRRVRSVEFKSKFVDEDEVDPNDKYSHPKDIELSEKFDEWKEPFIWILIQYYEQWRTNGLKEPKSVIAFTKQYQAQNDHFKDFFEEFIIKDKNASTLMTMDEVWLVYKSWHSDNDSDKRKNKKDVKTYIEKRIGQHHMASNDKSEGWVGYRCKESDNDDGDFSIKEDLDQTYAVINPTNNLEGLTEGLI